MSAARARKRKGRSHGFRRIARYGGIPLLLLLLFHAAVANWFVHHPREWLDDAESRWPRPVVNSLLAVGNPVGDLTDGLDLTGHDTVYEYDVEAPNGTVLFAGAPVRQGAPCPDDVRIINRGPFLLGWSDRLRHAVWCAYHVTPTARYETSRKSFRRDSSVPAAPKPGDYSRSGYDRGHLAPNHAIVTRYGESAQRSTYLMSNIAPQTPSLNRGVWRDVEHRIADLWTARYGEIWVIVGCLPSASDTKLHHTDVDVPDAYYQLIVAQEGMDVRALAVLLPQRIAYDEYAARHLITIDALEELTGLDFLPELPSFIQTPLEADLPTRLWPVRFRDIFRQLALRFVY